MRPDADRDRVESGQVAGIEVLAFGVLVFVFGTLLSTNAWAIVEARLTADAAAREAGRSYAESAAGGPSDVASAQELAQAVVHDRLGARSALVQNEPSGRFSPCRLVTWTVRVRVQGIQVPLIGLGPRHYDVVGHHRELVERFKDGLAAGDTCG